MIFKLLTISSLIYFIYKFFISPSRLGTDKKTSIPKKENEEFTDYEEIE